MENRKRNVQIIVHVKTEERALIEEKMKQIPTINLSAYARKMLIDGYIILFDTSEIKAHTAQLQKTGRTLYRFTGSYNGQRALPSKVLRLMEQDNLQKDDDNGNKER